MNQFNLQPILSGTLIELRPLRAGDFDSLYVVASDPLIWQQHPQSNRYEKKVFRSYFDSALESRGAFLIREKNSGQVMGSSRYYDLDSEFKSIKIGYTFLARKFWGGLYNKELKKLMIDHACLYVPSILFEVGAKNFRSQKALEKIGARKQKEEVLEGEPSVTYRLDRPQ